MDLFSTKVAYASVDTFIANVNTEIINPLITFLFALAIVFFLYGMLEFFWSQANEEKKTVGKSHMFWGVIGITIMMGVFFFMNLIIDTIGVEGIDPEKGEVDKTNFFQ